MHNNYFFSFSDFLRVITEDGDWHYFNDAISPELASNIFQYHFIPQNEMRIELDIPMRVTGCYRPYRWELQKGRSGTSQHCFPDHNYCDGKGASDVEPWYIKDNTQEVFVKMAESLISKFKRVCFYPGSGFFHSDYRAKHDQRFFMGNDGWEYVPDHDEWIQKIKDYTE